MKNKTEIILNDILIDECEGLLNLSIGDIFYFSKRGTTPKSEVVYKNDNYDFKPEFLDEVITAINKDCKQHHIHKFIVKKVVKSYTKDYNLSVSNPTVTFVESIIVEEWSDIKEEEF